MLWVSPGASGRPAVSLSPCVAVRQRRSSPIHPHGCSCPPQPWLPRVLGGDLWLALPLWSAFRAAVTPSWLWNAAPPVLCSCDMAVPAAGCFLELLAAPGNVAVP